MRLRAMNAVPQPLIRNQALEPAQDFYELRRRGIGFIEKAGSALWTDYNIHDPGITILEAAAYAITDVAYRMAWSITDILAPETPSGDPAQPYPDQAFYSARRVLTVNPVTADDYRRLLIDLPGVRDAWLTCKQCACETSWLAWCQDDRLQLGYVAPPNLGDPPREVHALGMYEALLELESDPALGDLNDRKIEQSLTFTDTAGTHPALYELRFPEVDLVAGQAWEDFLDGDATFGDPANFGLTVTSLGATQEFDVFSDLATAAERNAYIRAHWRQIFYATIRVESPQGTPSFVIRPVAIRVFGDNAVRDAATAADWRDMLENRTADGVVLRFRSKAKAARAAADAARAALQAHRNLDEDFCTVRGVRVEEVAACADVEVRADADIERIQAWIWFELARYFNPPVPFRTLQEMRDSGTPVEDIFNGPELENGFIRADELEAAALRRELRVSDILNKLMDIDGVVAVNKLLLTKYDGQGNPVKGAADPQWVAGMPVFDPDKVSAAWLMFMTQGHQPRLYRNLSRFLFYKNGLPFRPRMDEALGVLSEIEGAADRPKMPGQANDLPVPSGEWRNPADYFPVQYSLPLAYGVGPEGLPSHVSKERIAQARNLKAYLMPIEQMLGNAMAQFAHSADLFSLDFAVAQTSFAMNFGGSAIDGLFGPGGVAGPGLTPAAVQNLVETPGRFLDRRNIFLDHLLARFGEDFGAYALLLTDVNGERVAQAQLIETKIAFLRSYPAIGHDRGKALDYAHEPNAPANVSGIKARISMLLGFPDLRIDWNIVPAGVGQFTAGYQLTGGAGQTLLEGELTLVAASAVAAKAEADHELRLGMAGLDAWEIAAQGSRFRLRLLDATNAEIGRHPALLASREEAEALCDHLIAWSAASRMIVVEHLLLRPKFPGDALYPACCDGGCCMCGEEDPYSFKLTFVMPGWMPEFADNLDFRRFADRTIREETPAHLLPKICWVGDEGLEDHPCDGILEDIAALVEEQGVAGDGGRPDPGEACACAAAIHAAFAERFTQWFDARTAPVTGREAVAAEIALLFGTAPLPDDIDCPIALAPGLWAQILALEQTWFADLAVNGLQFGRFENAWRQWLEANAAIDWTGERLQERVEAILTGFLQSPGTADKPAICACAKTILAEWGATWSAWLDGRMADGAEPDNLGDPPAPVIAPCPGLALKPGAAAAIAAMLTERYRAYRKVSYWLRAVVGQLAGLRNIYPGATLHDCDDGSDQNPVRLDNTALGNYPRRTTPT